MTLRCDAISAASCHPPIVLVLDFLGRGKRTDCQQRSKIEDEDDDENEDDWGGFAVAESRRIVSPFWTPYWTKPQ
jgi:hypothetical protein